MDETIAARAPGEEDGMAASGPPPGARRVMLIRHAEKPHGRVRGIRPDGRRSSKSLTTRGWQRAGALAQLFREPPRGCLREGLSVPAAIYASRVEAHETSRRPRRTVKALARALGLEVDHHFGSQGEDELVARIRDTAEPVLVCWHHEAIPKLAAMIAPGLSTPATWPGDRFDIVWVLDRAGHDAPWTLTQIPQLLLDGDQTTVIGP